MQYHVTTIAYVIRDAYNGVMEILRLRLLAPPAPREPWAMSGDGLIGCIPRRAAPKGRAAPCGWFAGRQRYYNAQMRVIDRLRAVPLVAPAREWRRINLIGSRRVESDALAPNVGAATSGSSVHVAGGAGRRNAHREAALNRTRRRGAGGARPGPADIDARLASRFPFVRAVKRKYDAERARTDRQTTAARIVGV